MKRIFLTVLALILVFALCSCKSDSKTGGADIIFDSTSDEGDITLSAAAINDSAQADTDDIMKRVAGYWVMQWPNPDNAWRVNLFANGKWEDLPSVPTDYTNGGSYKIEKKEAGIYRLLLTVEHTTSPHTEIGYETEYIYDAENDKLGVEFSSDEGDSITWFDRRELPDPVYDLTFGDKYIDAWQQLYIDYVNESFEPNLEQSYNLFYVNDDDIPELFIDYGVVAAGMEIVTAGADALDTINYGFCNISYLERGNLFIMSGGRMDIYFDYIYEIQDEKFIRLHTGEYGTADNSQVEFDENGYFIYQYFWDGTEVPAEEYELALVSAFDYTSALQLESLFDANEIIPQIVWR